MRVGGDRFGLLFGGRVGSLGPILPRPTETLSLNNIFLF